MLIGIGCFLFIVSVFFVWLSCLFFVVRCFVFGACCLFYCLSFAVCFLLLYFLVRGIRYLLFLLFLVGVFCFVGGLLGVGHVC